MGWSNAGWLGDDSGWYKNASSADAAQTTAFLARTSGLSGTETTAYKALINGLVSDGVWSKLDALYIFATNTTTTANLNLVSSSFTLTTNGTVTFTADTGYTGGGSSTDYLSTGFTPSSSGTAYTLNSASLGVYILNNRTGTGVSFTHIGALDASNGALIQIASFGANAIYLNQASQTNGSAPASARGLWIGTRTGASANALYGNGNTTALFTGATASTALPTVGIEIFALNNNGSVQQNITDQMSAAFIGGGLSSTDQNKVSNRINAYMTALGINVY